MCHMVCVMLYDLTCLSFLKYHFDTFRSLLIYSRLYNFIFEITVIPIVFLFPTISYYFHFYEEIRKWKWWSFLRILSDCFHPVSLSSPPHSQDRQPRSMMDMALHEARQGIWQGFHHDGGRKWRSHPPLPVVTGDGVDLRSQMYSLEDMLALLGPLIRVLLNVPLWLVEEVLL